MADLLLTLIIPNDMAQHVEDWLLSRPALVHGFTASTANGHGSSIQLVAAGELVSGHAPRTQIQTVGPEEDLRQLLTQLKADLPRANIFFWLAPLLAAGRL